LYLLALWSADSPNNRQISGQEAAVVGAFNTIRQSSNQFNLVNVAAALASLVVAAQLTG